MTTGDSPTLRTRRVRRSAGTPGVVQLVCLELAAVLVVGAALIATPLLIAAGLFSVVLLAAVFGRADRRWWYEQAVAHWRLGRRRRSGRRRATAAPGAAAMATLMPGLAIRNVVDRGRSIGVGSDDEGWFAAVEVGPFDDASGERAFRVDLEQLVRILDETTVPISVLQLASHSTVEGLADDAGPAVRSYRELVGPEGCPVDQALWLAVRLDPADALEAAASRGGGVAGVDRALAAVIGRLEKALAGNGVPYQVLDAEGLGQALTVSCGLTELAGKTPARERWTTWRAGALEHVAFTVTHWPREPAEDLVARLSRITASTVAFSLSIRPRYQSSSGEPAFAGVVRVAAPPPRLRAALRQLTSTSRSLRLRLRRLDGDQARAVYATAPTGAAR